MDKVKLTLKNCIKINYPTLDVGYYILEYLPTGDDCKKMYSVSRNKNLVKKVNYTRRAFKEKQKFHFQHVFQKPTFRIALIEEVRFGSAIGFHFMTLRFQKFPYRKCTVIRIIIIIQ